MATRTTRSGGSGRPVRARSSAGSVRSAAGRATTLRRGGLPKGGDRERTLWLGINAALGLALAAIVVCTVIFWAYPAWSDYRVRESHKAAAASARQLVVNFLTISASSVTKDIDEVLDGSTGDFRKQYQAGMSDVRAAVVENKVSSTGKVLRSGVVSGDADSAVVLVAVDATIKNVHTPKGRKAHYRVQVDMVYDDKKDRWLVSRLDFVG